MFSLCMVSMKQVNTVPMLAPKFVVPYRMSGKRGKNDAADAAAIAEAVTRPNMRLSRSRVSSSSPACSYIARARGMWSSAQR